MTDSEERLEVVVEAIGWLDETFQSKARLGIFSCLMATGEMDFKGLKDTLGLTDGNLSAHLTYLENRGLVVVQKSFQGRKSATTIMPTNEGRSAFREHLAALENLIAAGGVQ